jgi:hypothetical protein
MATDATESKCGALAKTPEAEQEVRLQFIQPVCMAANGTNAASSVCLRVGKRVLDAAGLGDEKFLEVVVVDGAVTICKRQ